jgi:acetyl esterase/lipase
MAVRPDLIYPELCQIKIVRHIPFNRNTLWLLRILQNLQTRTKMPGDIQIKNINIQSQDRGQKLRLRIYRPKMLLSSAPVLIWIHGGGYIIGKPEISDPFLARVTLELGILIVSIDYRLAPEHPFPAPLDDCYAALKWVYTHAASLNIDPDQIAIGGESAGGGLAAALVQLAYDRNEVHPIFQMLVYPMLDDRTCLRPDPSNKALMTWSPESNRFGWESYLNQQCGSESVPPYSVAARRGNLGGLPPAWVCTGTLDLFYEEDVAYAGHLKNSGVDCELVVIPGAFHAFDFFDSQLQVVEDFRKSQIAALKKHLFPE